MHISDRVSSCVGGEDTTVSSHVANPVDNIDVVNSNKSWGNPGESFSVPIFSFYYAVGSTSPSEHLSQVCSKRLRGLISRKMTTLRMLRLEDHISHGTGPPTSWIQRFVK